MPPVIMIVRRETEYRSAGQIFVEVDPDLTTHERAIQGMAQDAECPWIEEIAPLEEVAVAVITE